MNEYYSMFYSIIAGFGLHANFGMHDTLSKYIVGMVAQTSNLFCLLSM